MGFSNMIMAHSDGKDLESVLPADLLTNSGKSRITCRDEGVAWRSLGLKVNLRIEISYNHTVAKLGQDRDEQYIEASSSFV